MSNTARRTTQKNHRGGGELVGGKPSTLETRLVKPPVRPPLRFHILCVPHTVTRKDYSACAYTQKALKFCKMMHRRGHIIYHYGHKDSEVECTEHIPITDNELFKAAYGEYDWKKEIPKHNTGDLCNTTYNKRAIVEVGKRKKHMDYLLLFWGIGHADVAKAHPDMISVEPGIGSFNTPCTPFSIYESYCVMNYVYGREKWEPKWTDAVIPNYFDLEDFKVESKPGDYFMYLGRIIESKGIGIAVEIAKRTGLKLKVAGQGNFKRELGFEPPPNVEIVGYLEPKERSIMLSGARALLAPTHYNEPFGGVTVEALLCGTPIITSDWGAFAENNIHGVTGYRCRNLEQFIWAAKNIDTINRRTCREFAEKNFSLERVATMYEEYFTSLIPVFKGKGFYDINSGRKHLDWMYKYYPASK